jgi:hypothetical protein
MRYLGRSPLVTPVLLGDLNNVDLTTVAAVLGDLLRYDGTNWVKIAQGAGGGLDADTVDGIQASGFATAAQGGKADSAIQPGANVTSLGSGTANSGTVLTANGTGGISFQTAPVVSVAGRTGAVTLAVADVANATPDSRTLTAGDGLTGGGTLAANRTFTLGTPGTLTTASTNAVTSTSHTHAVTFPVTSVASKTGDVSLAVADVLNATPDSRTLTAGDGLVGGGNLTANRTFTLGTPGTLTTASTNAVSAESHTHAVTFPVTSVASKTGAVTLAAADVSGVVDTSTNQTIGGTKTFSNTITGSVSGNAGTVTNGVYTSGNQTIAGVKTFSSTIIGSVSGSAASITGENPSAIPKGALGDGPADNTTYLRGDRTWVTAPPPAANSVTNAILRDSVGLSVIGRAANTTGDPGDIVAATDGHVLRLSGTNLGFGQIAASGIANGIIDVSKIVAAGLNKYVVNFQLSALAGTATNAVNNTTTFSYSPLLFDYQPKSSNNRLVIIWTGLVRLSQTTSTTDFLIQGEVQLSTGTSSSADTAISGGLTIVSFATGPGGSISGTQRVTALAVISAGSTTIRNYGRGFRSVPTGDNTAVTTTIVNSVSREQLLVLELAN